MAHPTNDEVALVALDLREIPADVLARAATIRRLDLSRNAIVVIPPSAFARFSSLTHFNVSRNGLRILPAEIAGLVCLKELHALSNSFRTFEVCSPQTV